MSGLQKFLLGTTSGGGGGTVTAGANVGAGTGNIFRDITGTTMNFRRLLAGAGMSITTVGDDVIVTNTGGGTSQAFIERFVAGAGQTLFTVANVPASAEFVWVSNGSGQYEKQNALDDYTVAGSNITFNIGRALNEVITIQYITTILAPATQTSIQFQDEGANLGASGTVDTVDFVGAGVTATRIGNVVTATIPGGAGFNQQIQDEGINLPQRTNVNFVGNGVTATDIAGTTTITIQGLMFNESFIGDGVTTVFNLSFIATSPYCAVFVNGLRQTIVTDYISTQLQVTFVVAPIVGASIMVDYDRAN